jgi:hypothetical protein
MAAVLQLPPADAQVQARIAEYARE